MYLSKTVYFPDYPGGAGSGLTVPFNSEPDLFRAVSSLSSYAIREMLGTSRYSELCHAANQAAIPAATFVRARLKEEIARRPTAAGIQATFKGGKGSPMHDWFPYLEGYSPDFVRSVISEYAPNSTTVLDPFCGSGTSALVAASLGKRAYYCEVNPTCRTIIDTKTLAQSLAPKLRHELVRGLYEFAEQLDDKLQKAKPDGRLKTAVSSVFGTRAFFGPENLDDVLRSRTLLDGLAKRAPHLGQLVKVAALRSLVPSSNLVRRGDLRFRTVAELSKGVASFRGELRNSIRMIASDLRDVQRERGSVEYVCANARDLSANMSAHVDLVVTSPPYLNGTNYFRNTKIELWFLRELTSKSHLRVFRDLAITAGINDVTKGKTKPGPALDASDLLRSALENLVDDAYDMRIPMMVSSYFNEMWEVAENIRRVSSDDARIAIDLGDSCYGNVWVPTDRILRDTMEATGFEFLEEVVLRERQSRDGRKLRQTLQLFKPTSPRTGVQAAKEIKAAPTAWQAFASDLPHQRGEFAKRNWGHAWHSMCSYQGKLKPSIAHHLVNALMPASGGRLLDPFSGVGTIPFEARLKGHVAYGFDISPAAVAISRAKLEAMNVADVHLELKALSDWIDDNSKKGPDLAALEGIRFNGPIAGYFHPKTMAEICAARDYFAAHPAESGARAVVLSALLHILHGNRPYALSRRSHPITPFSPTGEVEYRPLLPRLTTKVSRLVEAAPDTELPVGFSFDQDATSDWPDVVENLDAIITSPPFFDSTRFYSANWMRLWFAGWDAEDFRRLPQRFVDEKQKAGLDVYDSIFRQSASRLKQGGYLALHVGKSRKCDMAEGLVRMASAHLEFVDMLDESVAHCESHGIRDKGTVTHHQYLLLRNS